MRRTIIVCDNCGEEIKKSFLSLAVETLELNPIYIVSKEEDALSERNFPDIIYHLCGTPCLTKKLVNLIEN